MILSRISFNVIVWMLEAPNLLGMGHPKWMDSRTGPKTLPWPLTQQVKKVPYIALFYHNMTHVYGYYGHLSNSWKKRKGKKQYSHENLEILLCAMIDHFSWDWFDWADIKTFISSCHYMRCAPVGTILWDKFGHTSRKCSSLKYHFSSQSIRGQWHD